MLRAHMPTRVGSQAQAMRTATPSTPRSVLIGAAFAGHEATVVAVLRRVADSVHTMLPAAVRAGNARLCAALLEAGRMAGAAGEWAAAAGGDVLRIRGAPSDFLDSYAGSERAAFHMRYIYVQLLPLTYIDAPLAPGGGKGGVRGRGGSGGGRASGGSTGGDDGAASDVGAGHLSGRGLLQRTVGGWNSAGAGQEQSAEEMAAALAAARAAAEQAADTALGGSSPLQSSAAAAAVAVAAAAATAAALAALTQPEASCGGSSSSSGSSGGDGGRAHQRNQACAFLASTTNHPAVRQLLLQWRPAEWQVVPPPRIRAAALPYAAAVGAWSMVSELLCGGIDPRDTDAPATLLYLALVQGRGAMAAWLLVRLLAHPFGYWNEIAGVAFAAIVTRIIDCISPLQLLLRDNPVSSFEELLCGMGNK